MAVLKCKMCGGDVSLLKGSTIVQCEYCGTKQTAPMDDNEKKLNLLNRATRLRLGSEFDKAAVIYESVIAEFPEEAEAYWGLCLCNYGIEYVDDPATGKKIPTCHRASFHSLEKDENFALALEYADLAAQKLYRDEARQIDRIMEQILAVSKNETPYDVFICYKETDENGQRTIDSVLAQDIYDRLTEKGLKVFFARITLEDKLGRQYEPYIFAALNSAKIMLCIGTKYEYFHAVWVKNEWSRFLKLMATDRTKLLIPCYKDMDAYDMPEAFKGVQAQDMGKVGAVQDLVRGVEKILAFDKSSGEGKTNTSNREMPDTRPSLVRNILIIGSNDPNDPWPGGSYTSEVNLDRFQVAYFHVTVDKFALSHKKTVCFRVQIYNADNALVFDEVQEIAWACNYDKFSKGWIIRGSDGSRVPTGKYRVSCTIENSKPLSTEFAVVSDEVIRQREYAQRNMRVSKNLCLYCGGMFRSGLFGEKCINCGRRKSY